MALDLNNPGGRRADLVAAMLGYLGPITAVPVAGAISYNPALHVNRLLRLAGGLGEVVVTIPANAPEGHSFVVFAKAGSWPRFVVGAGGSLLHPLSHTRGVPLGAVSVLVVENTGTAAAVAISGATTS